MTDDQIRTFYRDIAEVCAKHKMGCMVGMWYSGKGHEEHGIIECSDITDTQMRQFAVLLHGVMDAWKEGIKPTPKLGKIHEVRGDPDEKN